MGLFDIFKRRSKKNEEPEKKPEPSKSTESQPTSDQQPATEKSNDAKSAESNAPSSAAISSESSRATSTAAAENSDQPEAAKDSDQPIKEQSQATLTADEKDAAVTADISQSEISPASNEASTASQSTSMDDSDSAQAKPVSTTTEAKEQSDTTTASYEKGLEKSRSTFGQKLNALLANFRHVDESFFDDLEDMLIESDVGFETSMRITDELREEVKLENAKKPKDVQNVIVKKLIDMYDQAGNGENPAINIAASGPTVLLFVGVNGVGKTTTIGKMAKMYKDQGEKVVLAAADTFRAGAIEQLNVWAERDGVDIVKGKPKSDPASVVFDAVKKARDESYDILMVDTAGRLQNKVNLMNELSKMKKILTREIPAAPHEVLLVLDATTGQNAMTQAKMFKEATDVTGIVLTKLDGTARGGIVLAIRSELHLPVKYVGLGEKVTDLKPFDPNDFVYGLFKGLISE
ncbi:signal recognition particle-docking protein FtsY [Lentilactobacillus sp. TOM.63]|uniref:signal recognition particle-docking protein FtsY n=1 Tax=Lentilactobacillus TaxID=2767893 RepID=UPI001C27FF92|nr:MULTISPECIES: signal recognition particle-docking protein FtsY [Lentilactobacillus]MBU9788974.1 signal recognition particle-docking protein FtsY [Lentilactobacillus dabitei]MDM7517085.1 signal recognition particle-docking protein FtsY [Lentilactobacillus sp. TOM.63]